MLNGRLKGNIAMFASKTFSGFNENALRYLLPDWMSAFTGVLLRLSFGTVAFWASGLFSRKDTTPITWRQRLMLLAIGAFCMFGYMFCLLEGLTYTTPISSSIFISMQPVWVFLICVIFLSEKVTWRKIVGLMLGLAGALAIILTQKSSDVASEPFKGNMFCLGSSVLYSLYLVFEKQLLRKIDMITVTKWIFTGGCIPAIAMVFIRGWHAPVLTAGLFSTPMLVLLFVLVFPTFISYFLVAVGLRNLSATVVALYSYLILIVAAVTSYILGQDHFSWWQMFAIAMIIISVYFVEIAEMKTNRPAPTSPTATSR